MKIIFWILTLGIGLSIKSAGQELDFVHTFPCTNQGSQVNFVKTLTDGTIVIGGQFQGTMDFDPGPNTININSRGQSDHFILYCDSTGNYKDHYVSNFNEFDNMRLLEVDKRNHVYKMVFYNLTGVHVLSAAVGSQVPVTFNSPSATFSKMEFDPDNNIVLTGSTNHPMIINNKDTIGVSGKPVAFLLKFNSLGKLLFKHTFNAESETGTDFRISNFICNSEGKLFFSGNFTGKPTITFSNKDTLLVSAGKKDGYFGAIDENANLLWIHTFPQSSSLDEDVPGLGIDSLNHVYCITSPAGFIDHRLIKSDSLGNILWTKGFKMRADKHVLHVLPGGDFYLRGHYYESLDMDPEPAGEYLASAIYPQYYGHFVASYDKNANIEWGKRLYAASALELIDAFHIDKNNDIYVGGTLADWLILDTKEGQKKLTSLAGHLQAGYLYRLRNEICSEDEKPDYYIPKTYADKGEEGVELKNLIPFECRGLYKEYAYPEFEHVSSVALKNTFYVTVKNRGCADSSNATLKVYSALSDFGLNWPDDWTFRTIQTNNSMQTISELLKEIRIPRMARNHEWRGAILYKPLPNPPAFGVQNLTVNILARIESEEDTMFKPETNNLLDNVRYNNNIGWHYFNIK